MIGNNMSQETWKVGAPKWRDLSSKWLPNAKTPEAPRPKTQNGKRCGNDNSRQPKTGQKMGPNHSK
jgi:hypothetical protein